MKCPMKFNMLDKNAESKCIEGDCKWSVWLGDYYRCAVNLLGEFARIEINKS
jgi:hypothetical protein